MDFINYISVYMGIALVAIPERFLGMIGFDQNNLNLLIYFLFWFIVALLILFFISLIRRVVAYH